MKTTDFNWGDDIIDSRDIISRYEELNSDYESLVEAVKEAKIAIDDHNNEYGITDNTNEELIQLGELQESLDEAQELLEDFESFDEYDELIVLKQVVEECENCSDWHHGEGLIHASYFAQYIEDLVNDCYEIPKEFNSGKWPWRHMNMDWDAAAEDAKQDYHEFTVAGETYYIRA